MEKMIPDFVRALDYGVLGLHARNFPEEYREKGVSAKWLRQSLNLFAALNLMTESSIFPENPSQLFEFMTDSMEEFVESLPERWQEQFIKAGIHQLGTMIEKVGEGNYYLADGFDYLRSIRYCRISDSSVPDMEYTGQKLFIEMCKGKTEDYSYIRGFLSDPRNRFIPVDQLFQTPEQEAFFKKYPDIRDLAYMVEVQRSSTVPCCPRCGAVLRKLGNGYCCIGSSACNAVLQRRGPNYEEIPVMELWIPNTAVIHNIYCPGQLERKIGEQLDRLTNCAFQVERWPDRDRVDFVVTFKSGMKWAIDAKMTAQPGYVLKDMRQKFERGILEERLIYILPNRSKKHMLNNIRKEIPDEKISCMTLNEFVEMLREEVEYALL